ncbi:speckle-type POZ protein isoform X2 [Vespa velutina]|uniref:speckle-type POZ protein isoform X2 n=1 Tax=Vespa velutina TaxID=202808 RepID=UPI001FB45A8D|nr:speckle-type POZ protein isoform X2 [Vespa velutina]
MEGNTFYIETTFIKYENPQFLWPVQQFHSNTILMSPVFLLPSCTYTVTMEHTSRSLTLEFDFDEEQYGGYLSVVYSMLDCCQKTQIINGTNKSIIYQNVSSFYSKFDLSLKVTHILPVTKQLPNFKIKHIREIMKHISSLHFNSELSDLTICVEDSVYPVHKCILGAHSPVFENIFTSGMKEQKEGRVYITDLTKGTCTSMMSYIYTNRLEDLDNIASELIIIADMYNILDLVKLCKDALIKQMNEENVFDTLVIADKLHMHDLELLCLQYISQYKTIIHSSKEYEDIKKYPNIVAKILDYFMG